MSTSSSRPSARKVAGFMAAIGALVMSSGIALLVTAPAAHAAPGDKWFVCKYVDTPGEPEKLQTGQNPISVSENAIPLDVVTPGASFADKQGRSVVLKLDDTPPGPEGDPDVSECAPPSEDILIAIDVVFTDPDCDNENVASYSVTGDTDNAVVEGSAEPAADTEVTVTATANDGYVFAGGSSTFSQTHTFGSAEDCSVVEPPVVEPPVVAPPVVVPPVATPTVVTAGLGGSLASADGLRTQQGIALLGSGALLLLVAGGLARPRSVRR